MGELITLSSSSHHDDLSKGLWQLCRERYKTDVALDIRKHGCGNFVTLHHLILAVFSPKFKSFYNIKFKFNKDCGFTEKDMNLVIEFIYLGRIQVAKEGLPRLKNAAEALGIASLLQIIDNHNAKKANVTVEESWQCENDQESRFEEREVDSSGVDAVKDVITTEETDTNKCEDIPNEDRNDNSFKDIIIANTFSLIEEPNVAEKRVANKPADCYRCTLCKKQFKNYFTLVLHVRSHRKIPMQSYSRNLQLPRSAVLNPNRSAQIQKLTAVQNLNLRSLQIQKAAIQKLNKTLQIQKAVVAGGQKPDNKIVQNRKLTTRKTDKKNEKSSLHKCPSCSFVTQNRFNLKSHMANIHQMDIDGNVLPKTIKCPLCDYVCLFNFQLTKHNTSKHIRNHFCSECDYTCTRKANLKIHINGKHRNERAHMCELCGYRSSYKSGLKKHMDSHYSDKSIVCEMCKQTFATQATLKAHLKTHGTGPKPYNCHLCKFTSWTRYSLKMHYHNVHKIIFNTTDDFVKWYLELQKQVHV